MNASREALSVKVSRLRLVHLQLLSLLVHYLRQSAPKPVELLKLMFWLGNTSLNEIMIIQIITGEHQGQPDHLRHTYVRHVLSHQQNKCRKEWNLLLILQRNNDQTKKYMF